MASEPIVLGAKDAGELVLDLPSLVESRMLIQANSGAGKSYAIRKLLEATYGQVQQIVIDLEGEFSTLRERFPDYVIAGKGGDTPADPKSAKLLARKLMEMRASAICDLSELPAHERVRFVRFFLEALVAAPANLRNPCLVVVDEAHHFCPESGQVESSAAVIDLCTRGRKRGLCAILATQRLAKLHKDATAELINVLIGRTGQDIDQRRAGDALGFATPADRRALRDLEPGEFYAFGPAISRDVVRFKVGEVVSRHPRVGERGIVAPPPPTEEMRAVLAKLADLPGEALEEARTVEDLRRELSNTRRDLTTARNEQRVETQACDHEEELERLAYTNRAQTDDINHLEAEVTALNSQLEEACDYQVQLAVLQHDLLELPGVVEKAVLELLGREDNPPRHVNLKPESPAPAAQPAAHPTLPRRQEPAEGTSNAGRGSTRTSQRNEPAGAGTDIVLKGPHQRILDAIAWMEALGQTAPSQKPVCFLSGYSWGGGFFKPRGELKVAGLVEYLPGECIGLTPAGRALALAPAGVLTLGELHDRVLERMDGPERKVLRPLLEAYPESMAQEDLCEVAGYSWGGGYFKPRGTLKTLGLLEYLAGNRIIATAALFPEGVPA